LSKTIATIWLSKEVLVSLRREVEVEASPEEVWEALASEEGRERWLDEPEREIEVEVERSEAPHRLVWWWSSEGKPATRVEFLVVAAPTGTRVVVTESIPSFPIEMLAQGLMAVLV
jgi:uncharacterized protein YndB with AHSA1/START domain